MEPTDSPKIIWERYNDIIWEKMWKNTLSFYFLSDNNNILYRLLIFATRIRGGSRTAATSKFKHFVIIVNGFQPLTIITKSSILNVAVILDPPLKINQ